ncbi:MAG: hypothetical protein CL983_04355 [Euryarchaeota archaeon]|nr:hypothetical protein [Euryarchaeota archaeon]|tara:strand:+ start:652 stop:915 length:264 start_codon:yes stop_codon:yes gene_type:complete
MRQHEEIKEDIIKFLNLCITYSEGSLNRKAKRLARLSEEDKIEMAKNEIKKWESYKQFTEHTIKELLKGDLDEWIENLNNPDFKPIP